jgi:hypothetical protein
MTISSSPLKNRDHVVLKIQHSYLFELFKDRLIHYDTLDYESMINFSDDPSCIVSIFCMSRLAMHHDNI